ncbi:5-(carboxyamino)imidazole ribonucleotide synthase [Rarobacter faecitabidus]|uniref:N5-carboxyaminoimidazole ribonucleotide synthase n=1 Tax=Rarobacter faecitabidus TaxID=13243 RepID=A0A542ZUA3_RARFA|nr:5-(carboxyamino)imidazole ribonucleotide synthase [Rarobacter faecitabidus]TQL63869.1 5-(carboxyamino)imidazole ribonucleotide synthase [Rarobacter faecitabidus]
MTAPIVAVIGGGQLARMMTPAATRLGLHLRVLVEASDGSAGQVVVDAPVGAAKDARALRAIADGASVLTFEHEHVDGDQLRELRAGGLSVQPSPEALLYARDKIEMRSRLTALGVPCPRWLALPAGASAGAAALDEFIADVARGGAPSHGAVAGEAVVKTARGGYDGKGVRVVSSSSEVADWLAGDTPLLVEEKVPFSRELAVLIARTPSGRTAVYPVVESIQRGGVCAEVIAPAPGLSKDDAARLTALAVSIAEGLDVTGVLAVELFEVSHEDGATSFFVNELAMRPHNSGHWTIDGAETSQFEQHLRAVLDLPLGPTTPRAAVTVMANVLGSTHDSLSDALPDVLAACPGARVELYGKEIRPGRKLGHVNVYGDDLDAVRAEARLAADLLQAAAPVSAGAGAAGNSSAKNVREA